MAKVETEHVFKGSVEQVFSGISQYDKYIKYLEEVSEILVLPAEDPKAACTVEWHIMLIKDIHYKLNMFHEAPHKISWQLVDSNLLKVNSGCWEFSAQGADKTLAKYSVDVAAKLFIPGSIIESLTRANLPKMFDGMQKLISKHGKKSS